VPICKHRNQPLIIAIKYAYYFTAVLDGIRINLKNLTAEFRRRVKFYSQPLNRDFFKIFEGRLCTLTYDVLALHRCTAYTRAHLTNTPSDLLHRDTERRLFFTTLSSVRLRDCSIIRVWEYSYYIIYIWIYVPT